MAITKQKGRKNIQTHLRFNDALPSSHELTLLSLNAQDIFSENISVIMPVTI